MKKINYIMLVILLLSLSGDRSIFRYNKIKFYKSILLKNNIQKLLPGDILIKKKEAAYLEWFGHCGIVTNNYTVAEFPKIGVGFKLSPLSNWYNENRYIAVLRLKNITFKEKAIIFSNIRSTLDKKYSFLPKNSENGYYCSSFIWKMFHFNREKSILLDLDSDSGFSVWPYDILFSNELIQIPLQ